MSPLTPKVRVFSGLNIKDEENRKYTVIRIELSSRLVMISDLGGGPKFSQTSTDMKFFEGTLNETTRHLLTLRGLP